MMNFLVLQGCIRVNGFRLIIAFLNRINGNFKVFFRVQLGKKENDIFQLYDGFLGVVILDFMIVSSYVKFLMRVKVLMFINKDFFCNYKSKILGEKYIYII